MYTIVSILFGTGSVLLVYAFSAGVNQTLESGSMAELHLMSYVYNSALQNLDDSDVRLWLALAYLLMLFAGLISMVGNFTVLLFYLQNRF